jgi:hypothetical protein
LTPAEYLQILVGFEAQLRRHSDLWGNLDPTPLAHELRRAWESTAATFREEHPGAEVPTPFWVRHASGEEPATEGAPSAGYD